MYIGVGQCGVFVGQVGVLVGQTGVGFHPALPHPPPPHPAPKEDTRNSRSFNYYRIATNVQYTILEFHYPLWRWITTKSKTSFGCVMAVTETWPKIVSVFKSISMLSN